MAFLSRRAIAGLLGVAAVATLAGPARADTPTFQTCDGYGTPTENGDGMTKEARGLFGLFAPLGSAGNTRRSTPPLGASGVAACDAALADSRLGAKQWIRRVSLLRARAIHDLAVGDGKAALADLDRAEAAVVDPHDAFYQRSMGLGIRLVRGYALRITGDREGALAIAAAVLRERPYNRQLGLALIAVAGSDDVSLEGQPLVQSMARVEPRLIDLISMIAFRKRDFQAVIRIFPQLVAPIRTPDRMGYSRYLAQFQESQAAITELLFRADRHARVA